MKFGSVLSLFLFCVSPSFAYAEKKPVDLRLKGTVGIFSLKNHEKPRIPKKSQTPNPNPSQPNDQDRLGRGSSVHLHMREQMLESQRISLENMQHYMRSGGTLGGPPSGILDPTRVNFEASF